jgi:hypothetical protein
MRLRVEILDLDQSLGAIVKLVVMVVGRERHAYAVSCVGYYSSI